MTKEEQTAQRMKLLSDMEAQLQKNRKPEDDVFYHHPSEDHIILSHTLFWVMSKPLVAKLNNHQCFLLLRKYQEEMLEAYLTESEDFSELLKLCNALYNILPYVMQAYAPSNKNGRMCRKLTAIAIIAAGYGGDIATDKVYDLLDDMDFNRYGKICCPKIEQMLPLLNNV